MLSILKEVEQSSSSQLWAAHSDILPESTVWKKEKKSNFTVENLTNTAQPEDQGEHEGQVMPIGCALDMP